MTTDMGSVRFKSIGVTVESESENWKKEKMEKEIKIEFRQWIITQTGNSR